MATHARRRYRLLAKNPSVPSHPPDPQVWLVHYTQAEPHKVVPAQNVKPAEVTQRTFQDRRWIESHGPLQRQEFMLHQRELWPQLQLAQRKASSPGQTSYPRGPVAQPPVAHPANNRFSGQYYQQQAGQSPAKRQRQNPQPPPPQSAHSNTAPSQPFQVPDTSIEDEEDVTYGDLLDQLTQRELSLTRYMQHHEWMEEIFSSPYATGQIVPMDLGFGLAGELSGVTKGVFDAITKPQDAGSQHRKLQPQELQDFEKRINEHTKQVEAEMNEMRESHVKAMADMKRSKMLLRAERSLRSAEHADIDAVVKDVEAACGGRVVPVGAENLVGRGGLKDKARPAPPRDIPMAGTNPFPGAFDEPMIVAQPQAPVAAAPLQPLAQTPMQIPPPVVNLQAVPAVPMQQDTSMSLNAVGHASTSNSMVHAQFPQASQVPQPGSMAMPAPQLPVAAQPPRPDAAVATQPAQGAIEPKAPVVQTGLAAAGVIPTPAPIAMPISQSSAAPTHTTLPQADLAPPTVEAHTATAGQVQHVPQAEDSMGAPGPLQSDNIQVGVPPDNAPTTGLGAAEATSSATMPLATTADAAPGAFVAPNAGTAQAAGAVFDAPPPAQ